MENTTSCRSSTMGAHRRCLDLGSTQFNSLFYSTFEDELWLEEWHIKWVWSSCLGKFSKNMGGTAQWLTCLILFVSTLLASNWPASTLKVAGSRKVLYFLRLLLGYVCLHLMLKTLTQKLDLDNHRLFHMDHGGALCAATSLNVWSGRLGQIDVVYLHTLCMDRAIVRGLFTK